MKTTQKKKTVAPGKKQVTKRPVKTKSETQNNEEEVSPYVDLDKANFTERPYHRPSSLGTDHEPRVI